MVSYLSVLNTMFADITGFQWDQGNKDKNWKKHGIPWEECEEVFFNKPLLIQNDFKHSEKENRFYALGKTNQEKKLFIVFTVRNNKVRVISARSMHKKEKDFYEKTSKY